MIRLVDVVNHVADTDGLIVVHAWASLRLDVCRGVAAGSRCGSRVRTPCVERRGTTLDRSVPPASVGSGVLRRMSSCAARGSPGATSRTRSQRVIHRVEPLETELVDVFGSSPARCRCRWPAGGRRSGAVVWGCCRRCRRRRTRPNLLTSASAICDRALLPVHRNSTLARRGYGRGQWTAQRRAVTRVQRTASA